MVQGNRTKICKGEEHSVNHAVKLKSRFFVVHLTQNMPKIFPENLCRPIGLLERNGREGDENYLLQVTYSSC